MAYSGRTPTSGFRSTPTKDTFSGNNSNTQFTLSVPTRTNDVEVFVENIQQEPVVAYSISGTTLTFTSAPPTGTNNIYVIHRGELVETTVHPSTADLDAVNGSFTGNVVINGDLQVQGTTVSIDSASVQTVDLGDNDRIRLGTSNDFELYHDSANSYITVQRDSLVVVANTEIQGNFSVTGESQYMSVANTNLLVNDRLQVANAEASYVSLSGDTMTGSLDVTGTVTADGLTVEDSDGATIRIQSSDTSVDGGSLGQLEFYSNDASTGGTGVKGKIQVTDNGSTGQNYEMNFFTGFVTGGAHTETKKLTIGPFGDIAFYEDTGSTPKFFWDASAESLGIGTSSPAATVEINGDTGLIVHPTSASTAGVIEINGTRLSGAAAVAVTRIKGIPEDPSGGSDASAMAFETRSSSGTVSEAMRIDSGGQVGIGTSTNLAKFTVNSGATNTAAVFRSTDAGCAIGFADDTTTLDASIFPFVNLGAIGNDFRISTNNTERMRIDSLGHVTIGRSGRDNATTDNGHNLYGTGEHFLYASTTNTNNDVIRVHNYLGSITFSVDADGDVQNTNNSYTALSDQSIKENIVDANSQWDDIKALQIRNYNLIDYPNKTHLGVVAQEVESAGMSSLVKENEDGLKSVKYSILYMKAVKALQEAIGRIETLETTQADLLARIETLEAN